MPRPPRLPLALFCLVLVWAPLPLGSYRPWAWDILALAIAVVILLILASALWQRRWPSVPPLVVFASCAYSAVIAWVLLQALLPVSAPAAHPIYAQPAIGSVAPGRIAIAPLDALDGAVRLSIYGLAFWAAVCLGGDARSRRVLANALMTAAVIVAVYGLWRLVAGDETIVGLHVALGSSLTGTFANRNHAAMFFNLALMVALARLGDGEPVVQDHKRLYLMALLDHLERRHRLLLALALLLVPTLLTASRGGVLSLACGLVVLMALRRGGRRPKRLAMALLTVCLVLGASAWFFGSTLFARMTALLEDPVGQTVAEDEGRWQAWLVTIDAIAERPLVGHGLGGFSELFLMARPLGLNANYFHAHNLYLELAAELGLPAAALLLAAGAAVLVTIAVGFARRRNGGGASARAALAAAAVVAVHSLVDFGLQIPANAVSFSVILGLAVAAGQKQR